MLILFYVNFSSYLVIFRPINPERILLNRNTKIMCKNFRISKKKIEFVPLFQISDTEFYRWKFLDPRIITSLEIFLPCSWFSALYYLFVQGKERFGARSASAMSSFLRGENKIAAPHATVSSLSKYKDKLFSTFRHVFVIFRCC